MTHRFFACTVKTAGAALAAGTMLAMSIAIPAAANSTSSPRWRITKSFPAKDTFVDALVLLPGNTAWAGGETPGQMPVLYHLVSRKWRATVLPGSPGTFVNQISATSATNVWATLSNTPAVEHLTRRGWVAHTFTIGTDQILLAGVVTVGRTETLVLAYDFATKLSYVYRYNGKHWSRKAMPAAVDANSDTGLVSGTSASNIWALTSSGSTYASMRFNGTSWQVFKFPRHLAPAGSTAYARQIFAESPRNVWATIFVGSTKGAGPLVLLHWNGRKWSRIGGKLPRAALSGPITSDGRGGLWLAATNAADTKALFVHYSNGKWTSDTAPTDDKQLLTITSLAVVPGSQSVFGTALIGETFGGTSGSAILKYVP